MAPDREQCLALRPSATPWWPFRHLDPVTMTGWSVTITGQARLVDDPEETARLLRLPLRPWVQTTNGQFIRIRCRDVTGGPVGLVAHTGAAPQEKAS
jgi:hypothetical protein